MVEEEKPGELEAFQDEIAKLKNKVEQLGFAVEDVKSLGKEEMEAWEAFKRLFNKVELGLSNLNTIKDVQSSESLKECLEELGSLNDLITLNFKQEDILANENRKAFLAWLKNRLVLSSNLSFLFPDKDTGDNSATEEDLVAIKNFVLRVRKELFV